MTLEGGGRVDYSLPASKEAPETRGFWNTVRDLAIRRILSYFNAFP